MMAKYINADNFLNDMICKFHCVPTVTNYECYDGTSLKEVLNLTPAADVAPVVHGEWLMYSYDEAICSCCGYNRNTPFESTVEAKNKWDELPQFCENCGTRMDGKDGE